jgi:hypothetical protein
MHSPRSFHRGRPDRNGEPHGAACDHVVPAVATIARGSTFAKRPRSSSALKAGLSGTTRAARRGRRHAPSTACCNQAPRIRDGFFGLLFVNSYYRGDSLSGKALIVPCENGKPSPADLGSLMLREVQIVNKLGLHARPAALFVRWVNRFKSTITIWKGGGEVFGGEPTGGAYCQFALWRPGRPRSDRTRSARGPQQTRTAVTIFP